MALSLVSLSLWCGAAAGANAPVIFGGNRTHLLGECTIQGSCTASNFCATVESYLTSVLESLSFHSS